MGGCIGGSYCFEAIEQAPDRVAAAVLQNPIGLWENRDNWDAAVKGYGETVRKRDPSISQETIDSFGRNMFGGDFVFSVTRDFVKSCRTPLYLQPGTDKPHPAHTSAEIAAARPQHRGTEGLARAGVPAGVRSGGCTPSWQGTRPALTGGAGRFPSRRVSIDLTAIQLRLRSTGRSTVDGRYQRTR